MKVAIKFNEKNIMRECKYINVKEIEFSRNELRLYNGRSWKIINLDEIISFGIYKECD